MSKKISLQSFRALLVLSFGLTAMNILLPLTALPIPYTRCCPRCVQLPGGGSTIVCDMPGLGCVCDPRPGE